jgi:hypothetical protein
MGVQISVPNKYPIPVKPDFAGMLSRVTQMSTKLASMQAKMMSAQIRVMIAPKPPGLPFSVALNFTSILKSFKAQVSFINSAKSLIQSRGQNWGPPNVRP